ncbi:MAG TPA: iron-sulfur cluster assembly accessory protein [Chlamydiales bacterium]|nr:iron-sulfur cluster assembly accessory protein [Chlamydiales bacterium]
MTAQATTDTAKKTAEKKRITRDMTIDSIFSTFPNKAHKLANAITKAGLHCVGCSASTWETLEAGMMGHGYSDDQIQNLLDTLNAILEEQSDPATITLTKRAVEKFREIATSEGKPDAALRFDEIPAGCSGFEYVLDFSDALEEGDTLIVSSGLNIHVRTAKKEQLLGCEIDFVDGLHGGFKISNPHVRHSCGCGTSHGY